jgi:hypothetical protein
MKTEIQLMEGQIYEILATLPFLYEKPKDAELYVDRQKYIIDHVRDMIQSDGSIFRLIRVFKLDK